MPDDHIDNPSRSDLALWEQALRNDWPIPDATKRRMLQTAVDLIDPPDDKAGGENRDRTRVAALRVLAQFARLNVEQQRIDLIRERQEREFTASYEAGPMQPIDPAKAEAVLRMLNQPDGHDHASP